MKIKKLLTGCLLPSILLMFGVFTLIGYITIQLEKTSCKESGKLLKKPAYYHWQVGCVVENKDGSRYLLKQNVNHKIDYTKE